MAQKKKAVKKKRKKVEEIIEYFPKGFWNDKLLPATILFLISIGLYVQSVGFDFVLDDGIVVAENTVVKKGIKGIGELLSQESFAGYFGEQKDLLVGARYRPLSLVSFAIEYGIFKDNPMGYHILNVLFYALTSLILYRLLFLFFPARDKDRWFWTVPFIATLLFVIHPVHVEVVANIKSRDEIYGLILSLLTLYLSLRYIDKKSVIPLVLSGITFWLALLAKENASTFLAIIPLSVYFFRKTSWKQLVVVMVPLVVAFGIYFIMRYSAIGYIAGADPNTLSVMNNPFKGMSFGERTATIFYTLLLYLKLLVFPHPLTHDYYPYQIPIMNWTRLGSLSGLVAYLLLGFLALKGFMKKNKYSYSILYYLLALVVVSNLLFPIGTFMNERFLYMPSVGFSIAASMFFVQFLSSRIKSSPILYAILGLVLAGFTVRTLTRVPAWENGDTLNSASIQVSKNSARANLFYGNVLFQKGLKAESADEKKALFEEAEYYFKRSEEILPVYNEPIRMRAGTAAELFRMDRDIDKLLESFYRAIQRNPRIKFVQTYVEYLNGRNQYIEELKAFYFTVGWTYLVNQRQVYDMGLKYLQYGLEIAPNDNNFRQAVGQTYLKLGDQTNAAKYLN